MAYFDKVKKGDKLYGLVFGKGKVIEVFEDSHYKMMVSFKNGYEVIASLILITIFFSYLNYVRESMSNRIH